jgi:hypothetical protein
MLVFGQIEPIGMGNLIPLPKKTAKGLQGAVYNQFAERMYRLLPHRSLPTPTALINFETPLRFFYPFIDNNDELQFTVITEDGKFLSNDKKRQYVRYYNPATDRTESREGFEQGYVVEHTVLPHFVVSNPATTPTTIATFTLPDGSGTKKVVGAGALGDGNTATIIPLLQYKPFVRQRMRDGNNSSTEIAVRIVNSSPASFDPPYYLIFCYYVDTPKERILLPATLYPTPITREQVGIQINQSNIPAEVRTNIAGVAVIALWTNQARIMNFIPIDTTGETGIDITQETLADAPPFNFHTANIPYNPRAIKTVGNRTFYLYPDEVRISALGRMWDIPDDLAPIGVAGGGGIVDVPNALDVLPFGSQFLLLTKQGVYRLFEPIEGEWTAVLLPYPPPRLVSPSALFPTPAQTTPQGVLYYGGMWFEVAGANETVNITYLPLTLLPLLKIEGSEPSIAVGTNGKVYLILDQAFYEVEEEGGKDVLAFNGRYFYLKDTSVYEVDPFAPV